MDSFGQFWAWKSCIRPIRGSSTYTRVYTVVFFDKIFSIVLPLGLSHLSHEQALKKAPFLYFLQLIQICYNVKVITKSWSKQKKQVVELWNASLLYVIIELDFKRKICIEKYVSKLWNCFGYILIDFKMRTNLNH